MKDQIEKLIGDMEQERSTFMLQKAVCDDGGSFASYSNGKIAAYTNVICELQDVVKAAPEQFGFTLFSKRKAMAVGIELMQDGETVQIQEFGDDAFSVTVWGSFARVQDILLRHFDEEDVKNILS